MSSRTPAHISDVEWCFTLQAAAGQRLLMRVALLFDQQALTPSRLTWHCADGLVEVDLAVLCEPAMANRVHAKLQALHDVRVASLQKLGGTPQRASKGSAAHASPVGDDGSPPPRDSI